MRSDTGEWKIFFIKFSMPSDVDARSGGLKTLISFVLRTIAEKNTREASRREFVVGIIP